MVTHLLDCCGKDDLKKFCWDLDGKKYRIGNVSLFIEDEDGEPTSFPDHVFFVLNVNANRTRIMLRIFF